MNTLKDYVDWKLTHCDKTAEAEGYPLIIENCKTNKKMKELQIYGNSLPAIQKDKNLFNIENIVEYVFTYNYAEWLDDRSGIIMTSKFTNGSNIGYLKNLCPDLKVGHKFVVSFETNAVRHGSLVNYFYLVGTSLQLYTGTQYTCTQEMLDGQLYAYSGETENPYIKNIQFEIENLVSTGELITDTTDINYGKYKIPVIQRSKNIFNIENLRWQIINTSTQWLDDHSGIIMKYGFTNGGSIGYLKDLCPGLKVGDKFVFNFETNAVRNGNPVRIFYLLGASLEMRRGTQYTCTQEMLDSDVFAYSGQTENAYIKNIQFEIGDTVTNYEPYKEPIITNIFLDEPLRKLGDYADYIDFKSGKVVRIIKEFAMAAIKSMGLYAYTNFGCTNTYRCVLSDMKNLTSLEASTYTFPIYSNMFPNGGYAAMQTKTSIGYSEAKYLYFNFEDENNNYGITDVDSCRAWLVQNNPIIYYPMDTPTEESIYCELPKLDAKTTIIEVDTSLTPSNAYGKYIKG